MSSRTGGGRERQWQALAGPLLVLLSAVLALASLNSLAARPDAATFATWRAPATVRFHFLASWTVSYPAGWALPLALLASALLLLLLALGLRRGRLTGAGVAAGTVMFGMVAVFVMLLTILLWLAGSRWAPIRFAAWLANPRHTPGDWLFFAGFAVLALAVFSFRYSRALRRERLADLVAGVLLAWLPLLLLTGVLGEGASYLFLWPVLAALPFFVWLIFAQGHIVSSRPAALSPSGWALAALAAVVALLLWLPFLVLLFAATALMAFPLLAAAVVLLLGLLLPLFATLPETVMDLLPSLAFLASLLFLGAGFWLL